MKKSSMDSEIITEQPTAAGVPAGSPSTYSNWECFKDCCLCKMVTASHKAVQKRNHRLALIWRDNERRRMKGEHVPKTHENSCCFRWTCNLCVCPIFTLPCALCVVGCLPCQKCDICSDEHEICTKTCFAIYNVTSKYVEDFDWLKDDFTINVVKEIILEWHVLKNMDRIYEILDFLRGNPVFSRISTAVTLLLLRKPEATAADFNEYFLGNVNATYKEVSTISSERRQRMMKKYLQANVASV